MVDEEIIKEEIYKVIPFCKVDVERDLHFPYTVVRVEFFFRGEHYGTSQILTDNREISILIENILCGMVRKSENKDLFDR